MSFVNYVRGVRRALEEAHLHSKHIKPNVFSSVSSPRIASFAQVPRSSIPAISQLILRNLSYSAGREKLHTRTREERERERDGAEEETMTRTVGARPRDRVAARAIGRRVSFHPPRRAASLFVAAIERFP